MSASTPIPQGSYKYDVLLSYNDLQKEWARGFARRLRDEGFEVWLDEWCLQTGENLIKGLVRGVSESRKLVLVLSPEFLDTQLSVFKAYTPIFKEPSARYVRLVPLVHTHCDLPPELASHQILDFSDTHNDALYFEFRLEQLMADLDPSRERPTDFNLFCATYEDLPFDILPPVGQLPMGSLMPFLPNPNFVGHAEELKLLYEELESSDRTSLAQTVALTGLSGIGKTQLAVEFVYRYGRRFSGGVFWLDVSDPEVIPEEILCCAGPEGMNLSGAGDLTQDDLIAAVMREWRGSQRRLVIFDGLEKVDVIDKWRPASAGIRALITTRIDSHDPRWADRDVKTISVDVLSREQSMKLLCRARRDALNDQGEREAANNICELLGDFPLAIHLAGAYLSKYRYEVSLKEYLSELRSRPILANPALTDSVSDLSPTQYSQDIATMFDTIIGKLNQLDEGEDSDTLAARLFHLASHFAPAPISRELLIRSLKMDKDKPQNRQKIADVINRLCELGLVQRRSGGRIALHPLLREFAYEHPALKQNANEAAEDVAKAMIGFVIEANRLNQTERVSEELEHIEYIARESERRGLHLAAALYNQLGYHFYNAVNLEGARKCYERSLEISKTVFGSEHPTVAVRNNNLGLALRGLGDLEGAREHYERALEINEATLGLDHPDVAITMNNLGAVLRELGDLEGARECFVRALQINEAAYGLTHPKVASLLNKLGGVEHKLGDMAGAEERFQRALSILEQCFGTEHPKTQAVRKDLQSLINVHNQQAASE